MTRTSFTAWLCAILLASVASAQDWTRQSPSPTATDLGGLYVASATEAWATGRGGVLLHTTDAGRTWTVANLPVDALGAITFVDSQHGWIVGNAIFRTTNGGATWSLIDFPHGTLGALVFVDTLHGWTNDNYGGIFRTTDGGLTWTRFLRAVDSPGRGMFFHDRLRGWFVSLLGEIERTQDGGQTWTVVHQAPATSNLNTIWFKDDQEGWAMGGNTVLHTVDGGASWQQRSFPQNESAYSVAFVPPVNPGEDPVSYAVGAFGGLVKSTDGWQTWTVLRPGDSGYQQRTVRFADADHGYVVGADGLILYTRDGGASWIERQSGGPGGFRRLVANDPAHAFAAAEFGKVLLTTDGGLRWRVFPVDGFSTYGTIEDVDFLENNLTGWATGLERGWGGNVSRVSRSLDGGRSWSLQYTSPLDVFFETIDALDGQTALACGWNPWGLDQWVRTGNGGQTWQDVTPPSPVGVALCSDFVDSRVGYVAGGRIWKTQDGGLTWTELPLPDDVIEGISFTDANNGWATGGYGYLIHTTDGGATWERQAEGQFPLYRMLDVSAVSPTEAWLVGDESFSPWRRLVAHTTDGGVTWDDGDTPVIGDNTTIQSVAFLDADYGWVGGRVSAVAMTGDGLIWKRTDGPPQGLALLHDRLIAGEPAQLRVTGAQPGDLAGFFLSTTGVFDGGRIDLLPPVYLLAALPVGAGGLAALDASIPLGLGPLEVHFQALVGQAGGEIQSTNTTSVIIEP